jgi:RNA polymerase sigma factor (sigma-70 family)
MGLEEKIIVGCIAGSRKSQKILFDYFKSSMMSVCLRYCKSRDEAEDVLMIAFMTIFSEIHTFRREGPIDPWIRRIVVNTAINNYKKNLKHYYHADYEEISESDVEEGDNFLVPDYHSAEEVLKVIQELPEGYRMVLNLYIVEGYKHKEIAEILDINIGTSKSQLSKAKKIIQEKLAHRYNEISRNE